MDNRIPPLITPFAILSISLALGATNVVVNNVTSTNEGTPRTTQTTHQKKISDSIYGKKNKDKDKDSDAKDKAEKAKEESEKKRRLKNHLQPKLRLKKLRVKRTPIHLVTRQPTTIPMTTPTRIRIQTSPLQMAGQPIREPRPTKGQRLVVAPIILMVTRIPIQIPRPIVTAVIRRLAPMIRRLKK